MSENDVIVELGEAGEIPGHTKKAAELFLLLKGHVRFTLDGIRYIMNENDIILCNSGQIHSVQGDGPNIILRLQIPDQFFYQELGQSGFQFHCNSCGEYGSERTDDYEKLGQLLTRLMLIHYQKEKGYKLEFKSMLLRLLAFLLDRFQVGEPAKLPVENGDQRIERIVSHIHAAYREEISLQDLADKEHISVHYLSRLFKRKMGTGFTEYLNQVRLSCAVNDLLHTKDSVIKIALNNGFSNVSSFNRLFQSTYGQSPAKYRALRQADGQQRILGSELNRAFQEESDLISYLRRFDVRNRGGSGEVTEASLDVDVAPVACFVPAETIIRAGRMNELLKAEVQSQLRQIKDQLGMAAVHFQCLFGDGMTDYPSKVYSQYACMQAVEFVLSLGVRPMLSFSVADFLAGEKGAEDIVDFLRLICSRFDGADVGRWQFEITYPDHMMPEVRKSCYQSIRRAVHTVVPGAAVGLQFIRRGGRDRQYTAQYLTFLKELDKDGPAFISLCLELPRDDQFGQDEDYRRYQGYTLRQLEGLEKDFGEAGVSLPEVVLMDWTTLASHSEGASKTFFRSAVILDEVIRFTPQVRGMAFWLNYYVEEAAVGKKETDSLAMYLFYHLKLPVYFSLRLLTLLYRDVIYHADGVLATRSEEGKLAVLVCNPCYFSPALAADQSYVRAKKHSYTVHLEGISGKAVIELYHMDNHKTAFYGQWASMGFPTVRDKDSTEHLERTVNLVYSVLEEQPVEGCTLSVTLEYNETAVFRLRRRESGEEQ